ncbi:MAG: SRPBCC family protein [Acidimicrobiales bacterium]
MPTIEERIDISASPSAVTEVLLDIDAAPLWTSGLERLELVEGSVGEPGCVGLAHYVEGTRRYVVKDRLVEAEPGSYFKSRIRGGGLRATVETTLHETPAGTRVTIRWRGTGTNLLTTLALQLVRGRVARRMQQDMRALRDLVESRSVIGGP